MVKRKYVRTKPLNKVMKVYEALIKKKKLNVSDATFERYTELIMRQILK